MGLSLQDCLDNRFEGDIPSAIIAINRHSQAQCYKGCGLPVPVKRQSQSESTAEIRFLGT